MPTPRSQLRTVALLVACLFAVLATAPAVEAGTQIIVPIPKGTPLGTRVCVTVPLPPTAPTC